MNIKRSNLTNKIKKNRPYLRFSFINPLLFWFNSLTSTPRLWTCRDVFVAFLSSNQNRHAVTSCVNPLISLYLISPHKNPNPDLKINSTLMNVLTPDAGTAPINLLKRTTRRVREHFRSMYRTLYSLQLCLQSTYEMSKGIKNIFFGLYDPNTQAYCVAVSVRSVPKCLYGTESPSAPCCWLRSLNKRRRGSFWRGRGINARGLNEAELCVSHRAGTDPTNRKKPRWPRER